MLKLRASFLLSSLAVLVSCAYGEIILDDKCEFHNSGLHLTTSSEKILEITATIDIKPLEDNSPIDLEDSEEGNYFPYERTIHADAIEPAGARFEFGICISELALLNKDTIVYVLYTITPSEGEVFSYSTQYVSDGPAPDNVDFIGLCSVPLNIDVKFMESGITLDIEAKDVHELTLYISKSSFSGNTVGTGIFTNEFYKELPSISYGICLPEFENLVSSEELYIRYTILDKNGSVSEQYRQYVVPEEGALADTVEFSGMCSFPLKGSMDIHRSGVELAIEAANIRRLTVRICATARFSDPSLFTKYIDFTDKSSYKFGLCLPNLANLAVGTSVYVWYTIANEIGSTFEHSEIYTVPPTGLEDDTKEFLSLCYGPLNTWLDFFTNGVRLVITHPSTTFIDVQFSVEPFITSADPNKEQMIEGPFSNQISFSSCRSEFAELQPWATVYVRISIHHEHLDWDEYLEFVVPEGGIGPHSLPCKPKKILEVKHSHEYDP